MVSRRVKRGGRQFWQEFRDFAVKGNVIDLSVAVIVGGAFGKIVSSFVADILMPLINPLIPGGNWREIVIGPGLKIGSFAGNVLDFVVIALAMFLIIRVVIRQNPPPPTPVSERECPYCLELVPIAAIKCRACASELPSKSQS
ncbi:large conductance mechanosensitive channel protein MscL [Synechococcus sp. PCC 6312]|uniref:large conductance mechanosensitive channel protein MscL n=1 Tax=Synechococcus sp. (strain ATCC 27167 / PCC 6312) TaxID=195253 RepID=UPI00029F07C8|nr:large conductance mechanosensitive channel protein [Synechococcus sp. PCC 6312]